MSRERIEDDLRNNGFPALSGNIYCVGRNYRAHALELGNDVPKEDPVIFLKSPSSLRFWTDQGVAFAGETFHHEIELVLLVGKGSASNSSTLTRICGMGLGIDLTRRGVQTELKSKGLPWAVSKNFKGSAILTCMRPVNAHKAVQPVDLTLYVNDVMRQKGSTKDMIFSIEEILDYLNRLHPLEEGDLIFTGTPEGVAEINANDRMRAVSQALDIDITGIL